MIRINQGVIGQAFLEELRPSLFTNEIISN